MANTPSPDFYCRIERHRANLLQSMEVTEERGPKGPENTPEPIIRRDVPQVLPAIERIILEVLESLSRNRPPVFILANRSSWDNAVFSDSIGLQMVKRGTTRTVKSDCPTSAQRFGEDGCQPLCSTTTLTLKLLSVIYRLVQSDAYATKRDIYYTDVQLYGSQRVVDSIISDISCMLRVPRWSLHILSTSKGCLAGDLLFTEEDGTRVDCNGSSTGILVPSNVEGITNVNSPARFILIIEKDATFQRLLDDGFCCTYGPCILITGKGFPDLNTRLLTRKLWDHLHVPIFALVDADPHGIEIMCIYKYGSLSMSFEAQAMAAPAVSWLGLLPSDIERLNVPPAGLLPLTAQDQRKLSSLQRREYVAQRPLWKREIEIMAASKTKAELQALSTLAPGYLSRVYLPNKLQYGGWI